MTYLCSISQCMGRIYSCVEINKMTLTIKCLFFEKMKQDVKNKSCANNEENWYSKKFRNIAKSLPLLQAFKNYYRLKNMLVCHHPGPLFPEHPAGQEFFFFFPFEMEKRALILIYLTWFSSSSLSSISFVSFFSNVHTAIINLAYFNPRNIELAD